jgi:hypothetical protein
MKIPAVGRHKVHHLVVPRGARVRWFAAVRQTTIILEDAFCDSVTFCERQTPCFVSSHVTGNVLVDCFDVVQTERIVIAIVVVTPHRTPWVPFKERRECNRLFLGQGRRIVHGLFRVRRTWFLGHRRTGRTARRHLIFSAQIKMLAVLGSRNTQDLLYNLTIFVLYVIILTFILRYLWNGTMVQHISVLRPVDTLMQTFLLALGISLFRL